MLETSAISQRQIAPDFHRKFERSNIYVVKGNKNRRVNKTLVENWYFCSH